MSAFIPHAVRAMLMVPFKARRRRFWKFVLTYCIPAIPLFGLFDGVVSALRIYEPKDLLALVEGITDDYVWEHGVVRYRPWGRTLWFSGRPIDNSE